MNTRNVKKLFIGALICVICVAVLAFVGFISLDRAGGEIGFDAVVVSVEGNWITAEVINDSASFFSRKLPDEIVFDATIPGTFDLEPGDYIHADYLSGTIDGNQVKVVSVVLQSSS